MAQIINDLDLGSYLGKQLAGGLSQGLNTLAQLKLQDLMQRQRMSETAQGLQGLGIPVERARQLSNLPEPIQKELFKTMREFLPISDLFNEAPTGSIPKEALNAQSINFEGRPTLESQMNQALQGYLGRNQPQILTEPQKTPISPITQIRPRNLSEAKQMQQQRAMESKEDIKQRNADWGEIKKKAKIAEDSKKRVARMKELVESKQLNRPVVAALVSGLRHGILGHGIDLSSKLTEESQEYEKLIQGFLPEAKAMFGARMTDTDLKEFLKGMPDLLKSRQGKRRMLHNLDIMNDTAILRKKVGDIIIRENGGRVPMDLDTLIDERADKQLTALSNKFKEGFKKIPKLQKEKSILGKGPGNIIKKLADFTLGKG